MFDAQLIKDLDDSQHSNFYRAKVISLDDPLNLSRVQIMIYGMTDDFIDEAQPWMELQFRDGIITYPNVDDVIWLAFQNGDIFRPIYFGTTYAGLNIDTEIGYTKFANTLGAANEQETTNKLPAGYQFSAIADPANYRNAFRNVNKIDKDKPAAAKDATAHYDVLTPESSWWRTFQGLKKAEPNTVAPGSARNLNGTDPAYGTSPYPAGSRVYPWYELRESAPNNWKSVYGGWRFLTEDDLLKRGLAKFPDNTRRIYLKRYKAWSKWTIQRCLEPAAFDPDSDMYKRAVTKSWDFVPMSPTLYVDPELYTIAVARDADGTLHTDGYATPCRIKPFPFGTMKIKDRKYYKQSSWFSYDGKSAIELDDNDNYERLRFDFNYGEGGLEFSRAGWHGLNMWTEGSFKIRAWGRQSNGKGEGAFNPSSIDCVGHSLFIQADQQAVMGGDKSVAIVSLGPAAVRSKKNVVSISGGQGVTIQGESGLSLREGASDSNKDVFFGEPVIAAPDSCTSPMQGYFMFLDSAEGGGFDGGTADEWMQNFNAAMGLIRDLCSALAQDAAALGTVGAFNTVKTAVAGAMALQSWTTPQQFVSLVKLAGAWEGIQIEGGRS